MENLLGGEVGNELIIAGNYNLFAQSNGVEKLKS